MARQRITQVGGSFAPPLTPEKLDRYRELAEDPDTPPAIGDAMVQLIDMVRAYEQMQRPARSGTPHPSGRGLILKLTADEIDHLWDLVPWGDEVPGDHVDECAQLGRLFDGIDPRSRKELRDAAHHLLWFARELAADRQPMTSDLL